MASYAEVHHEVSASAVCGGARLWLTRDPYAPRQKEDRDCVSGLRTREAKAVAWLTARGDASDRRLGSAGKELCGLGGSVRLDLCGRCVSDSSRVLVGANVEASVGRS